MFHILKSLCIKIRIISIGKVFQTSHSNQRYSYSVTFALHSRINPVEKTPHLFERTFRNKLNPVSIFQNLNFPVGT